MLQLLTYACPPLRISECSSCVDICVKVRVESGSKSKYNKSNNSLTDSDQSKLVLVLKTTFVRASMIYQQSSVKEKRLKSAVALCI